MKKAKKKVDQKLSVMSEIKLEEPVITNPLDILTVKVLGVRTSEVEKTEYDIKITFFDELILKTVITSSWTRDIETEKIIAQASLNYDPSDYEKMCLFADTPLIVTINPIDKTKNNVSKIETVESILSQSSATVFQTNNSSTKALGCNVDILPLFLDIDEMHVRVRMQPVFQTSVLNTISWDNLPLLTIQLSVERNEMNAEHHKLLAQANFFRFTLVGCYNLPNNDNEFTVYTAASKSTMFNGTEANVIRFDTGYTSPKRFSHTSFYTKWESVRLDKNVNSQSSVKFHCDLNSIQNDDKIDLERYLSDSSKFNNIIWASFHRTLLMKESEPWFYEFLRKNSWPFELRISGNNEYSLMAFLDLFQLLYPGMESIRLAVPLQWLDEAAMRQKCDCNTLFGLNDRVLSTTSTLPKFSKPPTESDLTSKTDTACQKPTGSDGDTAFVIVEVALQRPFKKAVIPSRISNSEIKDMLKEMESKTYERECTGRGQLAIDWQNTVKNAANSLRRIPYYGSTDFCTLDRQLSLTRTRVEILTSFSEDAAIYVNNNFIVENFLESDETFEELLLMAHSCLMKEASNTLSGGEICPKIDPSIRAARHARYFQDIYHASDLYFHALSQNKSDGNIWRELGTCLQDIDPDWADVCLDKALMLNPRNPLTLLSKACIIMNKDPEGAEQFFLALIFYHPFWLVGLVAAYAYCVKREYFEMADKIIEFVKKTQAQGLSELLNIARAWEHELGDWWESTPLLPGISLYYDAADLLLRIRAINLAEVCIAQAFMKYGDCPAYYHLLALCCRLKGDFDHALCHIHVGLQKFGEISWLRALEAECYHVQKDRSASIASFEKAAPNYGSYSTLLSMLGIGEERSRSLLAELLRRQPSAYSWLAFADEWIAMAKKEGKKSGFSDHESSATKNAIACAIEALKIDKQAGRAWALLARLVEPTARKVYCARMAVACGHSWPKSVKGSPSPTTSCHQLGKALRECRCKSCTFLEI